MPNYGHRDTKFLGIGGLLSKVFQDFARIATLLTQLTKKRCTLRSERLNQILEDMLRACVMDFTGSWDTKLHLMKFSYNNSFQATIGMAPFEALYGKQCRSPLCWEEVGGRELVGP